MSFGLPVVTTSLGVEGMDVADGREVMVADDPQEFATKVVALYRDDVLWNQISMRALSFSQENYSPAQVGQRLRALLLELGVRCAPVRETDRADSALARV